MPSIGLVFSEMHQVYCSSKQISHLRFQSIPTRSSSKPTRGPGCCGFVSSRSSKGSSIGRAVHVAAASVPKFQRTSSFLVACPSQDAFLADECRALEPPFSSASKDVAHVPVLLKENIAHFQGRRLKSCFDCTLGAGGHASTITSTHPEMEIFLGLVVDPVAHFEAYPRLQRASASHAQNTPASSRGIRFPRYSANSQIFGTFNKKFRAGYSLGPRTQPLIKLSFRGQPGILQRIRFLDISGSHIQQRRVIVYSSKPKPWWKQFLFQQLNEEDFGFDPEDGSENGESDMEEDAEFAEDANFGFEKEFDEDDIDNMLDDDRKFNSWQQKRNAVNELREYQETGRDPDSRDWEDWLDDSSGDYSQYMGSKDGGWYAEQPEWEKGGMPREAPKKPERGMNRTIKELLLRIFETQEEVEDDLNFEERVFRFTSKSTAKFATILILVPWAADFLVHDYVMLPFLRRWVNEVPLAAKILDVKESQKLHMIERLKLERQRVRFEAEIGKAPPLSDEELNEHIREEALELREDLREENRSAFANLWSDAVAGFSVLLLLVFNPQQVSIMRMTGDRLFTNISDTGKAFIIILCTDIFLGYHSESGWETVIEILLDHYGLEVSQGSIYIFVAIVPVTIDACFKLWVFRYLTRLSPSAAATFREMKRH